MEYLGMINEWDLLEWVMIGSDFHIIFTFWLWMDYLGMVIHVIPEKHGNLSKIPNKMAMANQILDTPKTNDLNSLLQRT